MRRAAISANCEFGSHRGRSWRQGPQHGNVSDCQRSSCETRRRWRELTNERGTAIIRMPQTLITGRRTAGLLICGDCCMLRAPSGGMYPNKIRAHNARSLQRAGFASVDDVTSTIGKGAPVSELINAYAKACSGRPLAVRFTHQTARHWAHARPRRTARYRGRRQTIVAVWRI